MINSLKRSGFYIIAFLLIFSCEKEEPECDPLFDPNCGSPADQSNPETSNLEANIDSSSVSISWESNKFALSFSYRLESLSYTNPISVFLEWSEWSPDTSVTLEPLDEGEYSFYVKSRFNIETEEETPKEVYFTVDAISVPALRIYPLNQTANTGDEIDVYLYFEDVPENLSVTGLHVDVQINTDELEFVTDNFEYGELITSFPGTAIYPNPIYSENGASVSIMGVADSSGTGMYGTGSIAKFSLRILAGSGTYEIIISQTVSSFLNITGSTIEFGYPVSGSVTVE